MCDKEYNDIAKVCPLDHCPNCGTPEIKKQKSRRLNKDCFDTFFVALIVFGMAAGFGALIINIEYPESGFRIRITANPPTFK